MPDSTVWVVAIHTGSFALSYGVARGQVKFRAHARVTICANFVRFLFPQHQILLLMGVVAAVAGEILLLVLAAHPQHLVVIVMAGLATGVAYGGFRRPLRAETDIRGVTGSPLFVIRAGAVTGYAAVVAATCQRTVGGIGNGVNRGIFQLMTGEALAFRSLCMGERRPAGKYDQGAKKTDFSLDSSHCYCCSTLKSDRIRHFR